MNEFEFIDRYLKPRSKTDDSLLVGIGDDAAILKVNSNQFWHISTDMLIADRHFFSDEAADKIAYKSLAVNFSDMAAMTSWPKWVLLSVAFPKLDEQWLNTFFESFNSVLDTYHVKLIGGDTTRGEVLTLNITIIGESDQLGSQRNTAKVGDDIWVTGQIGLAVAALYHHWNNVNLQEDEFKICEQARIHPAIRVDFMFQARNLIHAAQDISDGLLQDLNHILTASAVGAKIDIATVPSLCSLQKYKYYNDWILNGGDDYEIVFTAPKNNREKLEELANKNLVPLHKIGEIIEGAGYMLTHESREINYTKKGFDHFEK
ncbi:MAG: thiamine-phosphate kinase [Neisseriaceae bacterium]|nr:MAG: thiamine-phosphate kinase [Neisseriaceae bacterium]